MILPAGVLLLGSFQDAHGGFTPANIVHLFRPKILQSHLLMIEVSLVTAVGGVPLAFAFIATLGRVGLITVLLKTVFGISLYGAVLAARRASHPDRRADPRRCSA